MIRRADTRRMLKRAEQFGCKVEAEEGAEESLAAGDYAFNFSGVSTPLDLPEYERERVTGTLTKTGVLKGVRSAMARATVELCGGAANTEPLWGRFLRAAGFVAQPVYKLACGVNEIPPGTFVFTAGNAKRFIVLPPYQNDEGPLYVTAATYGVASAAFVNGDVVTVGGAEGIEIDTVTAAGWCYRPRTDTVATDGTETFCDSLTIEHRIAGERRTVVGSRGKSITITAQHGQPVLMQVDFEGLPLGQYDGSSRWQWRAGDRVSGVTLPTAPPKMAIGSPLTFDDLTPTITNLQMTIANELAKRATVGEGIGSVIDCGYLPPRVSGRTVNISMDPLRTAQNIQDYTALLAAGVPVPLYISVGKLAGATAANGVVTLYVPKLQLKGNDDLAEREGFIANNVNGEATGDGDDEVYVSVIYS